MGGDSSLQAYGRAVSLDAVADYPRVVSRYLVTSGAVDALTVILKALGHPAVTHAWSITGPYGTGKSAFAVFLASLLGRKTDEAYSMAAARLGEVAPSLTDSLTSARADGQVGAQGSVLAVATAQREPTLDTLKRGLANGVRRAHSQRGRRGRGLDIDPLIIERATPLDFVAMVEQVTTYRPVFFVVDEFGKNLEYAAEEPSAGDLYVLQRLAELLSSGPTNRGGLVTLQHMAFADYVSGLTKSQRQEWAKVQGRFQDIPFLESSSQVLDIVCRVLSTRSHLQASELDRWSRDAASAYSSLDLSRALRTTASQLAEAFPLHPLTLAVLPELVARYGQHNRTLFTFLSADERHSLPRFERDHPNSGSAIRLLGLDTVYDYFISDRVLSGYRTDSSGRLAEIASVVADARTLDPVELKCLKTIALLNSVAAGGPLRASPAILEFALTDARGAKQPAVPAVLQSLSSKGLITFRGFADEYRVWRGSSYDIQAAIESTKTPLRGAELLGVLDARYRPRPLVANRHSQRTGTLRYFQPRYSAAASVRDVTEATTTGDGVVVYAVGELDDEHPWPTRTSDGRPVVVAWSPDAIELGESLSDALALERLLSASTSEELDPVAIREMRERLAVLQERVDTRLRAAWDPARSDVRWTAGTQKHSSEGRRGISRLLSDLCDGCYTQGLTLNNEMLNRDELTSQGAKARRVLMQAMVTAEDECTLGIGGFGPERAMYESVVRATGMHSQRDGKWTLGPPGADSGLLSVWDAIDNFMMSERNSPAPLSELYALLANPPFGMRQGPMPVLALAVLIHRADEVAVYQDGTFEAALSPETVERLLKAPTRFAVSAVLSSQQRVEVVARLREALGASHEPKYGRNRSALSLLRILVSRVRDLPDFSRRTKTVSPTAQDVRAVITQSRDIQDLIFVQLPAACGVPPFTAALEVLDDDAVNEYSQRLSASLDELSSAYPNLTASMLEQVRSGLGAPHSINSLREELRERATRVKNAGAVGRLLVLANALSTRHSSDQAWIEAIGMTVTGKAPPTWHDNDTVAFVHRLHELTQEFERFEHLSQLTDATNRVPGFDACLVSLARPGIEEQSRVVWVNRDKEAAIEERVKGFLTAIERDYPEGGRDTFLAVVCRQLLGRPDEIQGQLFDTMRAENATDSGDT